ncbi:hypothetical protein ACEXTD_003055 [Salmonella enterica]
MKVVSSLSPAPQTVAWGAAVDVRAVVTLVVVDVGAVVIDAGLRRLLITDY